MAKTYEDLIGEARELLQDTVQLAGDQRYTDAFLVNQLNRGLQEIARLRPDAYYDTFDANALTAPKVITDGAAGTDEVLWTENISVSLNQFYTPLLAFITGSAEITDDEFTLEGRAMLLLTNFRNALVGMEN